MMMVVRVKRVSSGETKKTGEQSGKVVKVKEQKEPGLNFRMFVWVSFDV